MAGVERWDSMKQVTEKMLKIGEIEIYMPFFYKNINILPEPQCS